jgi:tetratricopeptide (TPR) repeat protein
MNQHTSPPPVGEPLPDSADPVEIAMDAERDDHRPDSPARRLLVDQGRLVRTQIASERMGVVLKVLTGVAGLIAAGGLAFMAWDAARTEALVVKPFSVPPELAQRGMTGEVAATRLLDGLARLQAETVSARAPGSYANDWGDEVQVQIPQTGVSIGELQDFLRGWLGRETSISGEVVRTATGYAVTARTGTEPGRTFTGTETEIDALLGKASEAVYETTQPEGYAAYLRAKQRTDEAAAIHERLTISGPRERRAWAFAEWASYAKTPEIRLERAQRAVELDPKLPLGHQQVASAQSALGRPEAALDARRHVVELLEGRRARDMAPWAAVLQLKQARAEVASALGDHTGAARLYASSAEPAPDQPPVACRQCSAGAYFQAATEWGNNHDAANAWRMHARGAALLPAYAAPYKQQIELSLAAANEDWPVLARAIEDPKIQAAIAENPAAARRSTTPYIAIIRAKTGRLGEAQALVAPTPRDCHPCQVARAVVAAAAGDRAASEREFGAAVRLAPSLPSTYVTWGQTRLDRGDDDGALRLSREAQKRGPKGADAVKLEADALARRGDHAGAARRYAAAAEFAPRWGALHLAWGRSLETAGGEARTQARARYMEAAKLHLSAADRAEVQRRLARPSAGSVRPRA